MVESAQVAAQFTSCPECEARLHTEARFCGICGTQLPRTGAFTPDSLVDAFVVNGTYRVGGVLGTGSMGVVYRAEQITLGRKVALKVISESADDDTTRARFRREARAASQLNHPNVVQVYDYGQLAGGEPYLAMELLTGETVEELLTHAFPLSIERVARLMIDVLSALEAAHEQGILHRDLKPANVFTTTLAGGREVGKVLDFGVATALDPTISTSKTWAPLTEAGFVCGTPAFMSPEQVQGKSLDQRSDLFSAGGLMYQMLTNERPFPGKSPVEVGANIVLKPLIPPRHARPDLSISEAANAIVIRAMEKHPDARFPSARAMLEALQPLAHKAAPNGGPPGAGLLDSHTRAPWPGLHSQPTPPTATPVVRLEPGQDDTVDTEPDAPEMPMQPAQPATYGPAANGPPMAGTPAVSWGPPPAGAMPQVLIPPGGNAATLITPPRRRAPWVGLVVILAISLLLLLAVLITSIW